MKAFFFSRSAQGQCRVTKAFLRFKAVLLFCYLLGSPGVWGEEVVVMTYNLLRPAWAQPGDPSWEERKGGIAETIKRHLPDVVGLQEEDEAMVRDLLELLPGYAYLYPVPANGAGILFRYAEWVPVEVRRQIGADGRWITEAQMSGKEGKKFYFYCAHFSPFEEWKRMMGAEMLLQMIHSRSRGELPVVFVGDCNSEPGSAPFLRLTDRGRRVFLKESFAELGRRYERTADSYRTRGKGDDFQIDFVFFSGEIAVESAEVLHEPWGGKYPSDHLPVLCRFRLEK